MINYNIIFVILLSSIIIYFKKMCKIERFNEYSFSDTNVDVELTYNEDLWYYLLNVKLDDTDTDDMWDLENLTYDDLDDLDELLQNILDNYNNTNFTDLYDSFNNDIDEINDLNKEIINSAIKHCNVKNYKLFYLEFNNSYSINIDTTDTTSNRSKITKIYFGYNVDSITDNNDYNNKQPTDDYYVLFLDINEFNDEESEEDSELIIPETNDIYINYYNNNQSNIDNLTNITNDFLNTIINVWDNTILWSTNTEKDCYGIYGSSIISDCNGDCGGTAFVDENAFDSGMRYYDETSAQCVGGNTGIIPYSEDCNNELGGRALLDECGVCIDYDYDGDGLEYDTSTGTYLYKDSNDEYTEDYEIEVYYPGFNESCKDCNGVVNGSSVEDDCGVCDGDNECIIQKTELQPLCGEELNTKSLYINYDEIDDINKYFIENKNESTLLSDCNISNNFQGIIDSLI